MFEKQKKEEKFHETGPGQTDKVEERICNCE